MFVFHSRPGLNFRLKQRYKNISARKLLSAALLSVDNDLLVTWLGQPAVEMNGILC